MTLRTQLTHFYRRCGMMISVLGLIATATEGWGRSNLIVKDIRVGSKNDHTRLAFILSGPSKLYVKEDTEHQILKIEAPEDTLWKIPPHSQQSSGLFEKYSLLTNSEGIVICIVSLKPRTIINNKGMNKTQDGYEYFIDMVEKEPPPPPTPPAPPPVMVQPVIEIKQVIEQETPKNPIQKINVIARNSSTTWLVIRSGEKAFFDFQNISSDGALLVYLPKTDWTKVLLTNQAPGMINNVVVDDDNSKQSTLMLMSSMVKDVVDQFVSPNQDGSFDCVLVIANRMASPIEVHRLLQKKMENQEQSPGRRFTETTVTAPAIQVKPEDMPNARPASMADSEASAADTDTSTFVKDAPIRQLEKELDAEPVPLPKNNNDIDAPIRQLEKELEENPMAAEAGAPTAQPPNINGEVPPPEWTEEAEAAAPEIS